MIFINIQFEAYLKINSFLNALQLYSKFAKFALASNEDALISEHEDKEDNKIRDSKIMNKFLMIVYI